MEWPVVLVGHRQKPSWCLHVRITPFMPPAFRSLMMASASKSVGAKMFGSSSPSPHSRPVKVFTVKWRKAQVSMRCQRNWRSLGTAPKGFGVFC